MLGVRVVSLGLLDGRHLGSHGHTRNKKTIAERIFSKFITINVMVMVTSEVQNNFVMIRVLFAIHPCTPSAGVLRAFGVNPFT